MSCRNDGEVSECSAAAIVGTVAHGRDLESGLLDHLRQFLLELGVGFAFVGSQYRLELGTASAKKPG